ncbi:MAG: hypothetical protein M1821_005425 [Bathelium mastoideum]|nr:MAG: hypothetical protein M1821_005425 [Bathelium mastoideum]
MDDKGQQNVELETIPVDPPGSIKKPRVVRTDSFLEENHVRLGIRSWAAVFVSCFAIMSQVFVVVAAGSVIAFIIRDLGETSISGWIIQAPLLMQAALSPLVGRLSDVLDRKWLAALPPLVAFVGAVISAKAQSMAVLIGGSVLIGTTLSTSAIVQAIPAEVLPLRYRALANGFSGFAGSVGGIIGSLGAGGVTNTNLSGWRDIFWIQAAFHLATSVGLIVCYFPQRRSDFPKMSIREYIWLCDPIGSMLYVISSTILLMSLDWAGGAYAWHSTHVAVPLSLGLALMAAFGVYEWKGRTDGLIAHVFLSKNYNFALSLFAYAAEGWMYYSAVNSVVPQIILNLGFEDSAWIISLRQLSFTGTIMLLIALIAWYSTRYKDLKSPLIVSFVFFLVVSICYTTISPNFNHAQIGYNVITAFGQSGPLTLIPALVQFTAPHAYLSTATGLAFSARAIGGAFGSAVLDAIINGNIASHYEPKVSAAALASGLPASSLPNLFQALTSGQASALQAVPGANATIIGAAENASHWAYARAYNLAWSSIIPFVVLAILAVACLKGVKELMTDHVEATVEKTQNIDGDVNVG